MNRGRARAPLRNNAEDELVIVLADQEDAVLSSELHTSGPDVITGSASNGIKDGHSLRSPSTASNPLGLVREGNSSACFSNYSKQSFARVYRTVETTMHALSAAPRGHLNPHFTHGEARSMHAREDVRIR